MLDRKNQPKFNTSEKIEIKQAEMNKLSNGVPVYTISAGEQDVVKFDFIFDAGIVYSENPLVAGTVNSLIDKGTLKFSSSEIAEKLDYYGAYLDLVIGKHKAQITLYTLNKYIQQTLEIVSELIFNATYSLKETEIFLQNRYQEFIISRQKTEFLANEYLMQILFGDKHPYGMNISEAAFNNIDNKIIKSFYKDNYSLDSLNIIISGRIEDKHFHLSEKLFGYKPILDKSSDLNIDFSIPANLSKELIEETENSLQSSIRIGKITLNKHHKDYFFLNITSILLGGYFGSRLMTNIREDKGYTYGIYSSNMSLLNAGVFSISAESGKAVYKLAVDEIYNEIKKLRTIPVSKNELQRVKNWIMGSLTKIFDGPFALSDAFRSILNFNLGYDYYERYFEAINSIKPKDILEISNKYLHEDSMKKVIVGAI